MKNVPMMFKQRDRELGSVAILVTIMWTALFGMAVMAVDFGYLYTKKRGLQSAADAALIASMPAFVAQNYTTADATAVHVAGLNGYTSGASTTVAGNTFTVSITKTHPTFFGGIFGMSSKTITANAVGQLTGSTPGPAIYASDAAACGGQWTWGVGFNVTGGGLLKVNGNVESNNKIHIEVGDPSCNGTNCQINGAAHSACTVFNDAGPGVFNITGGTLGGPGTDPLIANTLASLGAFCTGGTSIATPFAGLPWQPEAGGCNLLPTGVYCASDLINVSPPGPGMSICPSTATFISATNVIITANGSIDLTGHPSVPNRIIAFANGVSGSGCTSGPTIQLSNGPGTLYTLNGSIYAPNGCINVGTGTPGFSMTGIMDGLDISVAMGPGQPWTFNGPGGLGGPTWRFIR
jgi:hypothetical protein